MNVLSDGNLHNDNWIIIKRLKRCVMQSLWGTVKYNTVQNFSKKFIEVCRRKVESISPSVLSDSLWPPWTVGSSFCGILQARILEWVAISYSRGSSRPRDWTCVSCIAGRFFTVWATNSDYNVMLFFNCTAKWLRHISFSIFFSVCLSQHVDNILHDTEYSSLCYTVGSCCLSILHIIVLSANPKLPVFPFRTSFPLGSSLGWWVCFCLEDMFICVIFWIPYASDIIWWKYYFRAWLYFKYLIML